MKELIAEGKLGKLLAGSIEFRDTFPDLKESGWRLKPEVGGGGHLIDNISHRIDLFVDLFGDTSEITGIAVFSEETGAENSFSLSVKFRNGIIGTATGNVDNSLRVDRFQIIGTEAEIISDPLDGCSFVLRSRNGEETFSFEPYPAPHLGLVRHIEEVLSGDTENKAPGRGGAITDNIFDKAVRSSMQTP
jgi:predicted dehydrogenase